MTSTLASRSPHDVPELGELATAINAMAAGLERARDPQRQFLLSVSHDLRTPLTDIRGYAEALAEGATDDVRSGGRDRGRGPAVGAPGAGPLGPGPTGRPALLVHPGRGGRGELVAGSVEASGQPPPPPASRWSPPCPRPAPSGSWADPDRLLQVLSNLIDNAFKFARHHITVGAAAQADSVVVWVLDDGPGIAPDDLPRVFEPHFRSDRSSTRRAGTGLGLAIVAELAAAMGGAVRAESPVTGDGGTRLVLSFPAVGTSARPALRALTR